MTTTHLLPRCLLFFTCFLKGGGHARNAFSDFLLYLDTYECSKHGGKLKTNVLDVYLAEKVTSYSLFRKRFYFRKQNFIKLGGAYVTSTGGTSSIKATSARYGGPTHQTATWESGE